MSGEAEGEERERRDIPLSRIHTHTVDVVAHESAASGIMCLYCV